MAARTIEDMFYEFCQEQNLIRVFEAAFHTEGLRHCALQQERRWVYIIDALHWYNVKRSFDLSTMPDYHYKWMDIARKAGKGGNDATTSFAKLETYFKRRKCAFDLKDYDEI